jgi:hypothetical protein
MSVKDDAFLQEKRLRKSIAETAAKRYTVDAIHILARPDHGSMEQMGENL